MKKYYGVLIALIPFITGSYKSLGDWSTSEMAGYNTFSLALIGFGIYYFFKHRVPQNQNIDFTQYDIVVLKASGYLKELSKDTRESLVVKKVTIHEIGQLIDLCKKRRLKKWKSQEEVDGVVSQLNDLLEENKKLVNETVDLKL